MRLRSGVQGGGAGIPVRHVYTLSPSACLAELGEEPLRPVHPEPGT